MRCPGGPGCGAMACGRSAAAAGAAVNRRHLVRWPVNVLRCFLGQQTRLKRNRHGNNHVDQLEQLITSSVERAETRAGCVLGRRCSAGAQATCCHCCAADVGRASAMGRGRGDVVGAGLLVRTQCCPTAVQDAGGGGEEDDKDDDKGERIRRRRRWGKAAG